MRTVSVTFFATALSMAFSLILCKALLLYCANIQLYLLPWLSATDALLGIAIALIGIKWISLSRIVFLITLGIYLLNMHFVMESGRYISVNELTWLSELHHLKDSLLSVANGGLIFGVILTASIQPFVSTFIITLSNSRNPRQLTVGLALTSGFLLLLANVPNSERQQLIGTPIVHFLMGFYNSSPIGHANAQIDPNSVTSFDSSSKFFPGHRFPPSFNNKHTNKLNVVILILESVGTISAQRNGNLDEVMPNLVSLMNNGVYWKSFYANVPSSYKTLFSLHTGLFPMATRRSIGNLYPRIKIDTLAQMFSRNGYKTALLHSADFRFRDQDAFINDRGYDILHDIHSIPQNKDSIRSSWGVDDKAIFSYAQDWIASTQDSFLLTLIPADSHHPYTMHKNVPRIFSGDDALTRFQNLVHYNDQLLGELVMFLKRIGRFDDTLFVILGDHGEGFGQHQGNWGHSVALNEENTLIPLVFSNPHLFSGKQTSDELASIPDILPSLIDLLKLQDCVTSTMDGRSLFKSKQDRTVYLYTGVGGTQLGLRDKHFKFIYDKEKNSSQLFNLDTDPDEQFNIAKQYPDLISFYYSKLQDWHQYTLDSIVSKAQYKSQNQNSKSSTIRLTDLPISFSSQDYGRLTYNAAITNKPFEVGSDLYNTYGFGTHANSIIQFDISKFSKATLSVKVARNKSGREFHERLIQAQIWLDGKPVYKGPLIDSFQTPVHIQIPVHGASLALVSEKTLDGGEGDHVDWIEPHLILNPN